MDVITKRDLIRHVAERWESQYSDTRTEFNLAAIEKLKALDPETASEADVIAIIENDMWTRLICNECNTDCNVVVQMGEPYDYESATTLICPDCLTKALALCEKAKE